MSMKTLLCLATEKLLLRTSGETFLSGVELMYAARLSPDRVSVMRTHGNEKFILMFHSRVDIRPFAANYPCFERLLRGLVHLRAWKIKSIEFLDIDFSVLDIPHLERTIDKLGVELVVLRNCSYHGVPKGAESVKLLQALNRKREAVVCEYGDCRLKHRLSQSPPRFDFGFPQLGVRNETFVALMENYD